MTKLAILCAVAVCFLWAEPAMAHRAGGRHAFYAQSRHCAYHEPGNPYSREEDYLAWSGWRARGGWDDSPRSSGCSFVTRHYRRWPGY